MEDRQNAQYLSLNEFASAIGLDSTKIRRMEKAGEITPHHLTPTGRHMYSQNQVDTWLARAAEENQRIAACLTDKEYAAQIGLTVQTLRAYEKKGILVPAFIKDRRRYYTRQQVRAYFNGDYTPEKSTSAQA